jgi:hypothetical protein
MCCEGKHRLATGWLGVMSARIEGCSGLVKQRTERWIAKGADSNWVWRFGSPELQLGGDDDYGAASRLVK